MRKRQKTTDETRQHQGRANPHKGVPHTEETRQRMSAIHKARFAARKVSDETRARMSAAAKARFTTDEGKAHIALLQSPETRAKLSAAAKARVATDEGRAYMLRLVVIGNNARHKSKA